LPLPRAVPETVFDPLASTSLFEDDTAVPEIVLEPLASTTGLPELIEVVETVVPADTALVAADEDKAEPLVVAAAVLTLLTSIAASLAISAFINCGLFSHAARFVKLVATFGSSVVLLLPRTGTVMV
jgi:hypothetical protein